MDVEISELSFAYALMEEIMGSIESEADVTSLGSGLFDWVSLDGDEMRQGISVFLHFKRPELMVMATAAEWEDYGKPYFRITIPRRVRSNIHRMLRSLSVLEPATFYVAPLFQSQQELDRLHLMRGIMGSTAFIPASLLSTIDDGEHHITGTTPADLKLDGEPLKGVFTGDTFSSEVLGQLADDQRIALINRGYLLRQYRTLHTAIFPGSAVEAATDSASIADAISRLMRIYLGGESLVVMRK